jgi:hypothetical protein
MKRTLRIAGIIALLAIIGFSMAACGGDSTVAPTLTNLIMHEYKAGVPPTSTPKSSFSINERFWVHVIGTAGDLDVKKLVFTIKGGTQPWVREWNITTNPPSAGSAISSYYSSGDYSYPTAGSYTLEAYAVDSKGNKSNTLTFAFEIK